jgi:hypothetical protein
MGAQDARVSDEMAKKFATEKETPYTAGVPPRASRSRAPSTS